MKTTMKDLLRHKFPMDEVEQAVLLEEISSLERQEQQRLDEAQREFDEHRTDLEMVPYREWLKGYIKAKKEILLGEK